MGKLSFLRNLTSPCGKAMSCADVACGERQSDFC